MVSDEFISKLSNLLGSEIKKISPISGGDISQAFLVETPTNRFFLKTNDSSFAQTMFETEKKGLATLARTKSIKIPKVYFTGIIEKTAFLLIEYIESKQAGDQDLERFGHQLADLHKNTDVQFGLEHDNYIGKLAQSNSRHNDWISFYTEERLIPQLKMAADKNLLSLGEIPSAEHIIKNLSRYMPNVEPGLLHGDLWSGNYLISTTGVPYLIDPAVYFGHGEIDIAMSRLFGGFGSAFYDAYFDRVKTEPGLDQRIEIYQLYYLLVHLNLFGSGYRSSVQKILQRYFN